MQRTSGFTVEHKDFLDSIPSEEELRYQLACNVREKAFLKRLLKIAIEKETLQPKAIKDEI